MMNKKIKFNLNRYLRQLDLLTKKEQERLFDSKVIVIGAGGLGSAALYYLTAAGIGEIGIVDSDKVSLSNLNRQILYNINDIGKNKVISSKKILKKLNPETKFKIYNERLSSKNIDNILSNYDFILDCTDNYSSKYLINSYAVKYQKPYTHAGAVGFELEVMSYIPSHACYKCIYPEKPEKNIEKEIKKNGIIGVTAGLGGILQATEAIKFILKKGELLIDSLLYINLLSMEFIKIKKRRNKSCSICGGKK